MSDKVSGREDSSNVIVSLGPDVCLTPVGSSMVPVAYTSVAFLGRSTRLSTTVLDNGDPDFQLNSRSVASTGHEPGVGRGVVVPGYLGPAHVTTASSTVFSEGWATARHRDPAAINRPGTGAVEPQIERTSYYETVKARVEGRAAAVDAGAADGGATDLEAVYARAIEQDLPARDLSPGTNRSVVQANGSARLVTGASAPPIAETPEEEEERKGLWYHTKGFVREAAETSYEIGRDTVGAAADAAQYVNDMSPMGHVWDQVLDDVPGWLPSAERHAAANAEIQEGVAATAEAVWEDPLGVGQQVLDDMTEEVRGHWVAGDYGAALGHMAPAAVNAIFGVGKFRVLTKLSDVELDGLVRQGKITAEEAAEARRLRGEGEDGVSVRGDDDRREGDGEEDGGRPAGDSETEGAVTNLGSRTVASNAELFDQLPPGEGMSGVFDHETGTFVLRHSTTDHPLPAGSVARYGGHASVRNDLAAALGQDLPSGGGRLSGFSVSKLPDGGARFGWNSGQINPGSHGVRGVPEALRPGIERAVRSSLGL